MITRKISFSILFIVFICTASGYAQCIDGMHTPFFNDSWLSCEKTPNPNPERPVSHWIQYDLGYEYTLDSTYVWNYNTWGNADWGMREVYIDYSYDGQTWFAADTVELPKASATVEYNGAEGPVLGNISARYVLITAVSNWGGTDECMGLSEIRFQLGNSTSTDPELEIPEMSVGLYPNPTYDVVTVSVVSEEMPDRIVLYDVSGKLISERTDVSSKNVEFDVTAFPSGVYLVETWIGEHALRERFVKADR